VVGLRKGEDSCCIRMWNDRVWTCVPLNGICSLHARNGVLMGRIRRGAAEDLCGAVYLFRDSDTR